MYQFARSSEAGFSFLQQIDRMRAGGLMMKRVIAVLGLAYLALRIVQMFAIADGLARLLHVPHFFSVICAFFLTWLPVIGPVLGGYGAAMSWGWSFLGATLVFASPLLAFALTIIVAGLFDDARSWQQVRLAAAEAKKEGPPFVGEPPSSVGRTTTP